MSQEMDTYKVTIGDVVKEYLKGTTYADIAQEWQKEYKYDILLVKTNGKLCELYKRLNRDCTVEFLTAKDKPGKQTYERSAVFLMLKSFYDTVGTQNIEKVSVEFSIGRGLFIRAKGDFIINQDLLDKVKASMISFCEKKIPIMKKSVSTADAIRLFHEYGMYDKEKLFNYRRVSKVNIYSIGGFEDYYYGYMVLNTGYIKYFDLKLFHDGFVLILPSQDQPEIISEFSTSEKVFTQLYESSLWSDKLLLGNVGSLNEKIASGKTKDMILIQEAIMEKNIADIAEKIISSDNKKMIMIAGPSSSGKTTFSHRLSIQLEAHGLVPHAVEVDNYFKNRTETPRDENGDYNYETLDALDVKKFNEDMNDLLMGNEVEIPHFNFKTGIREYNGNFIKLGKEDVLVMEGIHCLNDKLADSLPADSKYKIYISALTQLNIDEHNRIPTTDGRLLRRIIRDARTRGASAQNTIQMWPSVRRGEEQNIFPYQDSADIVFNSALVYELAALKQYAEPLLFGIPKDSVEYIEAKRLLKFLDYFLGIPSDYILQNSIIREFIGGSCFNV